MSETLLVAALRRIFDCLALLNKLPAEDEEVAINNITHSDKEYIITVKRIQ